MKRILLFITLFFTTISFAQTKFEKDVFDYTNMVRTNPKGFAKLIQNDSSVLKIFGKDSIQSVVKILNNLDLVSELVFDETIYENMSEDTILIIPSKIDTTNKYIKKDGAVTRFGYTLSITQPSLSHNNNYIKKYNYSETLTMESTNPLLSVVSLLVDRGWYNPKSKTHKPHFDNIINIDHTKGAVKVFDTIGGKVVAQNFSNQ